MRLVKCLLFWFKCSFALSLFRLWQVLLSRSPQLKRCSQEWIRDQSFILSVLLLLHNFFFLEITQKEQQRQTSRQELSKRLKFQKLSLNSLLESRAQNPCQMAELKIVQFWPLLCILCLASSRVEKMLSYFSDCISLWLCFLSKRECFCFSQKFQLSKDRSCVAGWIRRLLLYLFAIGFLKSFQALKIPFKLGMATFLHCLSLGMLLKQKHNFLAFLSLFETKYDTFAKGNLSFLFANPELLDFQCYCKVSFSSSSNLPIRSSSA